MDYDAVLGGGSRYFDCRFGISLLTIFRFRNLMIPPTHATLRLLQLSHGFLQRCRPHFREFLQLHSHLFPPLQVPASPIIEVKSHTLEHYLFTFRTFLRHWTPTFAPFAIGFDLTSVVTLTRTTSSALPQTFFPGYFSLKPICKTLFGRGNVIS